MTLLAAAGSKLYIGTTLAYTGTDLTSASFTSMTWTEITGVTDLGSAGDKSNVITSNWLGNARTAKAKGVRDAGQMQVVCDLVTADAGQLAAIAAEQTPNTYAFKVEFNDAPSGGTPSMREFAALVSESSESYKQANNTIQLNLMLDIVSNIVATAAA